MCLPEPVELTATSGLLRDPRPGYWLAKNANAVLWWCESGWKIGRDQVPREPSRKRQPDPIKINLARGEYELVYDKYLNNFAAHRISPYSFFPYDLIRVQFRGNGTDKRAQLDFSQFDQAAARWLDTHKFNSFRGKIP